MSLRALCWMNEGCGQTPASNHPRTFALIELREISQSIETYSEAAKKETKVMQHLQSRHRVMETRQTSLHHPGSVRHALCWNRLKQDAQPRHLFTSPPGSIHGQRRVPFEQRRSRATPSAAVSYLYLNNKLKPVKFPHCHYQPNYIIELKTLASCKTRYQNAGADITTRVPKCARRLLMPGFKDFCEILGYKASWSPCPPEIGQFEVISLELLWREKKNASRFPLSTTTMIMVVQPIIIIFQNRGQIFMGTWWVRLITVIIFPRL